MLRLLFFWSGCYNQKSDAIKMISQCFTFILPQWLLYQMCSFCKSKQDSSYCQHCSSTCYFEIRQYSSPFFFSDKDFRMKTIPTHLDDGAGGKIQSFEVLLCSSDSGKHVFVAKFMKTIENLMQVLGCHFVIVFLMAVPWRQQQALRYGKHRHWWSSDFEQTEQRLK